MGKSCRKKRGNKSCRKKRGPKMSGGGNKPLEPNGWAYTEETGKVSGTGELSSTTLARFKHTRPLKAADQWGMKINLAHGKCSSLSQVGIASGDFNPKDQSTIKYTASVHLMNGTRVIKQGLVDGRDDIRIRGTNKISSGRIDIRIRDKIPEVLIDGGEWEPFIPGIELVGDGPWYPFVVTTRPGESISEHIIGDGQKPTKSCGMKRKITPPKSASKSKSGSKSGSRSGSGSRSASRSGSRSGSSSGSRSRSKK